MYLVKSNDFNISDVLECGQCFRFEKLGEGHYKLIAFSKVLEVRQDTDGVWLINCDEKEYLEIWKDYFDMDTDYGAIKKAISQNDYVMSKAIEFAGGIRLINQDPWECLISFIISQNNRIPRIQSIIKTLSEKYGTQISGNDYAFPTKEQLKDVTEEQFFDCKMGFRAKYLKDAVAKVNSGVIDFSIYKGVENSLVSKSLMGVAGVGPKVSDCVMLFSLRRREVFPTDVWVKRIMQHYYFEGKETSIDEIHKLAFDKYCTYAGYAQQYLFHYARKEMSWN